MHATVPVIVLPDFPRAVRPLRRVEFDKLVEHGMFGEDERLELLRGFIVPMSPIGAPHSATVRRVMSVLVAAVGPRGFVYCQSPLAALEDSEPQPDVMVVPVGDYDAEHPSSTLLIVEVADSSLSHDRGIKLGIYAECGVPEYWIVNLKDRVVEVYTEPHGTEYRAVRHVLPGESLTPSSLPDVAIAVSDFLR